METCIFLQDALSVNLSFFMNSNVASVSDSLDFDGKEEANACVCAGVGVIFVHRKKACFHVFFFCFCDCS